MTNVTQGDLTRQESLLIWLRRAGITQKRIAVAVGVQSVAVGHWLKAERISSWRRKQLVDFGIPSELLPPAVDKAPGRKPQQIEQQA